MTETPESRREATTATGTDRYGRPTRLGQVLAWVGIIAGVLFIVAVIFFSGLFLGWSSGGHYGRHHGWHQGYYGSQMQPGGQGGSCSTMSPGGMMGPGQMGPGGMMSPSLQPSPTTSAPSTPRP